MKTIEEEIKDAIQNVADNYGIVIKQLKVNWDVLGIEADDIDTYITNIKIVCAEVITSVNK